MESTEEADRRDGGALGRDEMNLAEFPVALRTDRVPDGLKTLEFEAGGGKLLVTGSDAYGLPTAMDADVIVGLIQLTKQRNNFADPVVDFTRYELLRLIGWPDRGENYRRLEESLHRWVGVTLRYDSAWWDNDIKCRVDASFHILESVVILDQSVRRKIQAGGRRDRPASQFAWNRIFFRSCQADNLKRLDLDTYFALGSAVSKQMYRFLDKRFYSRADWTFDLREFALGHVGLSRNYTAAKIKEKLQPALEELEAIGFLEPMGRAERYTKVGRGEWKIALARQTPRVETGPRAPEPVALPDAGAPSPGRELIARGVTPAVAAELAEGHPAERIAAQLEVFDWLLETKDKRVAKNPAGFLVKSIRDDFAIPKGFEAAADRARRLAAEEERRRRQEKSRLRGEADERAREAAERSRVDAYWDSLSSDRQQALQAEALCRGNPFFRRQYEQRQRSDPAAAEHWLRLLIGDHIVELLDHQGAAAAGADPAARGPVV